jgi:hypothetical protein
MILARIVVQLFLPFPLTVRQSSKTYSGIGFDWFAFCQCACN